MNWFAAGTTGFGLGLVSFGTLWLTIRRLTRHSAPRLLIAAGSLARLSLAALVFYALGREGLDKLLAGLAGLWLARRCLIGQLGMVSHGR